MIRRELLEETIALCKDVIARAEAALDEMDNETVWQPNEHGWGENVRRPRENPLDWARGGILVAALKRRSMDLSRILSTVRR